MVRTSVRVLLTLLASTSAAAQPASTDAPTRVLALWADSPLGYAVQQADAGLRPVLAGADRHIDYYSEFMDASRFAAAAEHETLAAYLHDRYQGKPPDVMVAGGRPALEFLLEHRQALFPSVPIVHLGLAPDEIPVAKLDDKVVGLAGRWNLASALDLALRLHPDTRHVAVVSGTSFRDRRLTTSTRDLAARLADRLDFTWLDHHTLDEMKAAVASLPPQTVVLFASMYQDASGTFFIPRDVAEQLAPVSNAPWYVPFDNYVGYGVVGGTMETWHAAGEEAGRIVRRILGGATPADAVAGARVPASTIVDWRQLQRWHIPMSSLPAGTEFRYRAPSLWEAYRTQVVAFAAIGVAQLFLIVALAVSLQRRRAAEATRREAEARATELRDELAHASRVTMLGELAATLAHEINQPLAAILSNAQATRRWLKSDQPDLGEIRDIVDDIIADDKRAGEIIHRMRALLKKGDATRARFDVSRSIKNVAALLHGELIAANVTLRVEVPETNLVVEGDEVAAQQVLLNLMLNGIQSIQDSGAAIRTLRVQAARFDGMARVLVHDTGPGVAEELRERLFEPFFTTRRRGLGVGLAICRRIAEAHGGTLDLGPSPAGGATFVLALPTAAAA